MKKSFSFNPSRLLFGLFFSRSQKERIRDIADNLPLIGDLERKIGVERATRRYLLYFLLPLWMVMGLLDWRHHRRTHIETTTGTHESMIHSLMMSEAGLPMMMGLFLDVNALVLALMIAAFFVHEATAFWDVAYAEERRVVTPNEQHIHSFLETIPFMAVSFLICLYWEQFRALMGNGNEPARFEFRPKREPLSRRYITALLVAVAITIVLPYAEEFIRCYRVDGTIAAHPPTVPPGEYATESATK